MNEHLHAVVKDDVVVNVVVMTPEVAAEFTHLNIYGDAELIDLDSAEPLPAVGWRRAGRTWIPPMQPEPQDDDTDAEP